MRSLLVIPGVSLLDNALNDVNLAGRRAGTLKDDALTRNMRMKAKVNLDVIKKGLYRMFC